MHEPGGGYVPGARGQVEPGGQEPGSPGEVSGGGGAPTGGGGGQAGQDPGGAQGPHGAAGRRHGGPQEVLGPVVVAVDVVLVRLASFSLSPCSSIDEWRICFLLLSLVLPDLPSKESPQQHKRAQRALKSGKYQNRSSKNQLCPELFLQPCSLVSMYLVKSNKLAQIYGKELFLSCSFLSPSWHPCVEVSLLPPSLARFPPFLRRPLSSLRGARSSNPNPNPNLMTIPTPATLNPPLPLRAYLGQVAKGKLLRPGRRCCCSQVDCKQGHGDETAMEKKPVLQLRMISWI